MGNYDSAFNFLIPLEDSHPSGQVTYDSDGATRFGLLNRWHPELIQAGFYTTDALTALGMAKQTYRTQYWNLIQGDAITSNIVAAQLLSIGVNDGMGTAIKLAQQAVGVVADGSFGPHTLAAINAVQPAQFLAQFDATAKAHYNAIVAAQPSKAGDLKGWYNRVDLISTYQG
jgi:lysozyme family protein